MKCGLIGKGIKYSYSKEIYGSFGYQKYQIIEIPNEDKFNEYIVNDNFNFYNITIPYKQTAYNLCSELDEFSKVSKVVNLIIKSSNVIKGYNTDGFGFEKSLEFNKLMLNDKNVLILGSGATSKTIKFVSYKLGAKEVKIVSRTNIYDYNYDNVYDSCDWTDVIINATPVGTFPDYNDKLIDLCRFNHLSFVYDVVYNPCSTMLLSQARELKIPCCNGLSMLYFQAVKNIEIISNQIFDDKVIYQGCKNFINSKINIVLIGLPGCGKSTIAKEISKLIGKINYDTDFLVEDKIGMSINEYFKNHSENDFRYIENKVISELFDQSNAVISTGGGAVLVESNINLLKRFGIIIFINRPIDLIAITNDRPLTKNKKELEELYHCRIDLYKKYADFIVDNIDLNTCIDKIIEIIK